MEYNVPHDLSPIMTFHRQWNGTDYIISPFNNSENIYQELLIYAKDMPMGLVFYFLKNVDTNKTHLHQLPMEFRRKESCISKIQDIQQLPGFAGCAHERILTISSTTIFINNWFQNWSSKS